MSIAKERAPAPKGIDKRNRRLHEEGAYFDREGLELTIDLVLNADEHAAHFLGQLFTSFRQAIDSGLQGINETRNALVEAKDLIYLYSPEHAAAIDLYRLHLEGELRPDDEPLEMLNAAINRTNARLRTGKTARGTRDRKESLR